MSTLDSARSRPAGTWVAILIACVATLLVCLPSADGPWGLAGLLLAVASVAVAGVAAWVAVPAAIVALVPMLIPSPMMFLTFTWEIALAILAAAMLLDGLRRRAAWLLRLGPVEVALVVFSLWALGSWFWSPDLRFYLIGARRMLLGLCALWVSLRLPEIAPRRWFDLGLIGGAIAISASTILHTASSGFSAEEAAVRRGEFTDLGWGKDNYLSTLLLLFTPSLLLLAFRGRRMERALAWMAFGLVTVVQLVIASRAGGLLFLLGALVQLLYAVGRHRLWVGLGALAAGTGLLLSPLGYGMLSRLDNIRDLASMTIRLWYFREAGRRLVEHLPWGLGLWQGYVNADRLQGMDPHNYWLLIGGDLGVPGLLLWATVLVVLARELLALRRKPASRELAFTLLLTFTLANVHTLVEPTFQGPQYELLFFWIVCGSLAYAKRERAPVTTSESAADASLAGPRPSPSAA